MRKNFAEYSAFFIFKAVVFPLSWFIPLFLEQKGITGIYTGILMAEVPLVSFLLAFPSGIINDRVESRKLILFAFLLLSGFAAALSFGKSFAILIPVFALFACGKSLFQSSFDSLFIKRLLGEHSEKHLVKYLFVTAAAGFIGLASVFLFQIIYGENSNFKLMTITACAVFAFSSLIAFKLKKTHTAKVPIHEYGKTKTGKGIIVFCIILFLFSSHWGAEETCYALFLKHYLHAGMVDTTVYMMCEFLAFPAAAFLVAGIIDKGKISLLTLFMIGVFFSGLTMILKVNPNYYFSLAMRMIHGASDGMVLLVTLHGLGSLFDKKKLGGNMGIWGISQVAGSLCGMMIYPKIGHSLGYQYSFIISGISLIITAMLILLSAWMRKASPREQRSY